MPAGSATPRSIPTLSELSARVGKPHLDRLIPTPSQQEARKFEDYDISDSSMRLDVAKALTFAHTRFDLHLDTDRRTLVSLLHRLEAEGPHPVYDQLINERNTE